MWRGVSCLGLGWLCLTATSVALAQDGSDLASPWSSRSVPRAPSTTAVPEVQDLRSISAPGVRVYGDGGGDELGWQDPERDLLPMGNAHFALVARFAYLPSDGEFREAIDAAGGPMLDICLLATLSLHLRFGVLIGAHGPLGVASRPLGSGYVRGTLLVGAHFGQLVSLRLGAELGPELVSLGLALGGAAVAQLGLRFADGHLELAVDLAIDVRPGSEREVAYTHVSPRIGGMLGVTF